MNIEVPPLRQVPAAWRTYVGALCCLLPALGTWLFASVFLLPRLEMIWRQAGLVHSRAQWLLDASHFFRDNGRVVLAVVVVACAVLESGVPWWPRCRWWVLAGLVFVLNAAVLVGLTVVCTAALLAASPAAHPR